MIGTLPTSLNVNGKAHPIRSDYRNILTIFTAFSDDSLTDEDKLYVCLKRLYTDFDKIPKSDYEAAYKAAFRFIECNQRGNGNSPRVLDWEKDEQLIFPAVNKAAGMEVRALPYLHWWTFLGYFQSVDHDDLFSYVLGIRQKRAKGKKLEKWEREFYNSNKALCSLEKTEDKPKTTADTAKAIFDALLEEGSE